MDRLDEVALEQILRQLPPSSLAAAQLVCKHWSRIILDRDLWKAHAARCQGMVDSPTPAAMLPLITQADWRRICLDSFARQRWHVGKVVLSATLHGHTAAVTCIATHNDAILTGSADSTARLYSVQQQDRAQQLARPQQQQPLILHHPAPVVAAAVVSRDVCVTATAKRAYLWRRGTAVRSFDVMPGGNITCLGLTDMQLLLGSTAGTVQQYDLYSGTQQLITRYDTAVTALLPLQQQQEQQQWELQGSAGDPEWSVAVGTADGQVVCTSCTTGQQLCKLPSRSRTKILALQVVQHHQQWHHHHQQEQGQPGSQQPQQGRKRKQQQDNSLPQQNQLLLVFSASSHLTCWWLSSLATSINSSRGSCYRSGACELLLAVQSLQRQENLLEDSGSPANAVYCMCMACPVFGSSCMVFGNSDGSLTVAEVVSSNSSTAADAGAAGSEEGNNKRRQLQPRQPSSQTSTDPSSNLSTSGVPATALWRLGVQCQNVDSSFRSNSDAGGVRLDVVRHCRLGKLSQILAHTSRAAASEGVGYGGNEKSNRLLHKSRQHAERTMLSHGIRCMAFTGTGQLAIGLESGHVCILKFRHLH